jgi:hypothetical protein
MSICAPTARHPGYDPAYPGSTVRATAYHTDGYNIGYLFAGPCDDALKAPGDRRQRQHREVDVDKLYG